MKTTMLFRRGFASWQLLSALTLTGGAAFAAPFLGPVFSSENSVSDILGVAPYYDTALANPWGLVAGPEGDLHVADDATGLATVYKPDGELVTGTTPIVIPPAAADLSGTGSPTGVAENEAAFLIKSDTNDFDITSGTSTAPAHYIFATEDGALVGYRQIVSATSGIIIADQSTSGAGYTGVALSWTGTGDALSHQAYAANFAQGRIDVFNSAGALVNTGTNFDDQSQPPVPAGAPNGSSWSPFNVKSIDLAGPKGAINRYIVVTYALHSGTAPLNDIPGPGFGYVNIFKAEGGVFKEQFIAPGNNLNSPWGMAFAHHQFQKFGAPSVLLIGNHGDGVIDAYAFTPEVSAIDGTFLGRLVSNNKDNPHVPLAFGELWSVKFGLKLPSVREYLGNHAILDEDRTNLYFSAGIVGENRGLVGKIKLP